MLQVVDGAGLAACVHATCTQLGVARVSDHADHTWQISFMRAHASLHETPRLPKTRPLW